MLLNTEGNPDRFPRKIRARTRKPRHPRPQLGLDRERNHGPSPTERPFGEDYNACGSRGLRAGTLIPARWSAAVRAAISRGLRYRSIR